MRYYVTLDYRDRVVFHGAVSSERFGSTLQVALAELTGLVEEELHTVGQNPRDIPVRLRVGAWGNDG